MTIHEAATIYGICTGGCGLPDHWRGVIDPFGVVHYANRRFTRRALRNMLLLLAKARREHSDPRFLNIPEYDWYYLWWDNVMAYELAMDMGVRLPARLSRLDRLRCRQQARRAGIPLSTRSAIYKWVHDAI